MATTGVRASVGWAVAAAFVCAACAPPALTRDGQLVFTPTGGRAGAAVLTANGVELLRDDIEPVATRRRSVDEPWTPPTGFLLPADGILRDKSTPVAVSGPGLLVTVRTSDSWIPSWGGEILLRFDALAPVEAFPDAAASIRAPRSLLLVIDGDGADVGDLADATLEGLGQRDRVALLDSRRDKPVMPVVPGADKSLVAAAVRRLAFRSSAPPRNVARTLEAAAHLAATAHLRAPLVVVLSDGIAASKRAAVADAASSLRGAGATLVAAATDPAVPLDALAPLGPSPHAVGSFDDRADLVAAVVPPPGAAVLRDLRLEIASVPAPAHVLEMSRGAAALTLDSDHIEIGDLFAGEARTEVARISLPPWVADEPAALVVRAVYRDAATDEPLTAEATVPARYSSDLRRIASSRHGDVIAYASALAMVRRLHRAFAGSAVDKVGGLRALVAQQATSMEVLARSTHDRALGDQAEVLRSLLGAMPD